MYHFSTEKGVTPTCSIIEQCELKRHGVIVRADVVKDGDFSIAVMRDFEFKGRPEVVLSRKKLMCLARLTRISLAHLTEQKRERGQTLTSLATGEGDPCVDRRVFALCGHLTKAWCCTWIRAPKWTSPRKQFWTRRPNTRPLARINRQVGRAASLW